MGTFERGFSESLCDYISIYIFYKMDNEAKTKEH